MSREIIVNSTPRQTRVALLEDGQLVEIYIERAQDRRIVGNVYKGRVTRVLPGMQAAFVDIGLKKDAFLYVLDVYNNLEEYETTEVEEEEDAGVDAGDEDLEPFKMSSSSTSIQELLKEGQEIVVQVSKEPLGTKGARVTSHITLPGRFLVYMPTVEHIGVSRRIASDAERSRLRKLIKKFKPPNCGFIVRTVGEGKGEEEFKNDMEFLIKLWESIKKKSENSTAPCLLHEDLDLVFRTIRDLFNSDVEKMVLDSEREYQRCLEFVDTLMPHLTDRVKLFVKDVPIFDHYGIESELEKALRKKIWLKSGGYIVIEQTEALVAIDVNTGKYVGKKNLEDTIVKTNLEAVSEIVRQIRLRDLGGIIILDFIDMELEENKKKVLNALERKLREDRSRTNVLQLSELGLVEMTRKRVKQSLEKTLCEPCSYCDGRGMIKSSATVCYEVQNALRRLISNTDSQEILIRVNPSVGSLLRGEERPFIEEMMETYKKKIKIKEDPNLHQEHFEVTPL
ncbi:MAG TPA: Rne/Rng family ribonuclease [Candidatus Limnocylindrales bacterium]|nr:Rne/Rng family ribonuclease [Candidatus Limnocylindrales bacterium]